MTIRWIPLQTMMFLWATMHAAHSQDMHDDAQRIFSGASPSVVTVLTFDAQGAQEATGSGVIVARGFVVTNCHVIRAAHRIRISTTQGDLPAHWVREDRARDLCIIASETLKGVPVRLRPADTLRPGDRAYAVGNPLGLGLTVSSGLVAAINRNSTPPRIATNAPISPGSSGGGLFDDEGRLIGITTAILGIGQQINLVLATDSLPTLVSSGSAPRPKTSLPAEERDWEKEAELLAAKSDWNALTAHAKEWHQAQPSAALPFVYLGEAQNNNARYDDAVHSLHQALERDPKHLLALLKLASILRSTKQQEAAEKELTRLEDLAPGLGLAPMARAEWRLEEGRLDEAAAQIARGLRLAPHTPVAWHTHARIEAKRGNAPEAARAHQIAQRLSTIHADQQLRFAQDIRQANTDPRSAQSERALSDAAMAQIAVGQTALIQNRLATAEEALRKATELAPDNPQAWTLFGAVLIDTANYDGASKALERALALSPDFPDALYHRARLRAATGHVAQAVEDLNKVLANNPDGIPALTLLGALLKEQKKFPESLAAWKRIDTLGKADATTLMSMAELQSDLGNAQDAEHSLARAEGLKPGARFHILKAKLLSRRGNLQSALEHIELALAAAPADASAWSSKGYLLVKSGRLAEAVQTLETAVRLAPDSANGWINLGEALLRSQNIGRAIQVLEKAVVLMPDAMDARLFLAQSYFYARLGSKAREHANFILTRHPGLPAAQGVVIVTYLLDNNLNAALPHYLALKSSNPAAAIALRAQAISSKLPSAQQLPE